MARVPHGDIVYQPDEVKLAQTAQRPVRRRRRFVALNEDAKDL